MGEMLESMTNSKSTEDKADKKDLADEKTAKIKFKASFRDL
jgi:hypothetical protein